MFFLVFTPRQLNGTKVNLRERRRERERNMAAEGSCLLVEVCIEGHLCNSDSEGVKSLLIESTVFKIWPTD